METSRRASTAAWEEMFTELLEYKQTHGDCNVPQKWGENPKLGSWCSNQRVKYRRNELFADRIKRLENIGFQFDLGESKKNLL